MINNTGYEIDHHELVEISKDLYVSMFTDVSYHSRDDKGYVRTHKEPQQLFINVALFHEELDFSIQQREFEEQADYFRYIAELQELVKNKEKIETNTYLATGMSINA